MVSDYRATKYCHPIVKLKEKKQSVADNIKKDYPRVKDMHAYIRSNNKAYKQEFMKAYNFKCSYCGASIELIPKEMFEIDHFIYEKSFSTKAAAGYIENLVLSCHSCNHRKSGFEFPEAERDMLHPDNGEIMQIFERNDQYYIVIADESSCNETINRFYKLLGLDGEIRRLDFLLMNMIGLQRKVKDNDEIYSALGKAIDILRIKRNMM